MLGSANLNSSILVGFHGSVDGIVAALAGRYPSFKPPTFWRGFTFGLFQGTIAHKIGSYFYKVPVNMLDKKQIIICHSIAAAALSGLIILFNHYNLLNVPLTFTGVAILTGLNICIDILAKNSFNPYLKGSFKFEKSSSSSPIYLEGNE